MAREVSIECQKRRVFNANATHQLTVVEESRLVVGHGGELIVAGDETAGGFSSGERTPGRITSTDETMRD